MARLYLMRHGQTLFNLLHRKQGWCDSPLTELGIEQAKNAGAWFREQGIQFDHAYSSTTERACDTLELVAPGMPYERLKGLKEIYFGRFEGVTEDLDPKPPYGDFFVQFGGESIDQTVERVMGTMRTIMERPGHESVLAVSHGGALANVLLTCGFDFRKLGVHIGNCAIAVLEYDLAKSSFEVAELVNPNA